MELINLDLQIDYNVNKIQKFAPIRIPRFRNCPQVVRIVDSNGIFIECAPEQFQNTDGVCWKCLYMMQKTPAKENGPIINQEYTNMLDFGYFKDSGLYKHCLRVLKWSIGGCFNSKLSRKLFWTSFRGAIYCTNFDRLLLN